MTFSLDKKYYTSVQDRCVFICDVETKRVCQKIGPRTHRIGKVSFSNDGSLLACGLDVSDDEEDGTIKYIWSESDDDESNLEHSETSDEWSICASTDTDTLDDSIVEIWNIGTHKLVQTIRWLGGNEYDFAI